MAVLDAFEQLPHNLHDLDLGQAVRLGLQVLQDGVVDIFENQIQLPLAPEHFYEVDDVVVLELLQDAHLAQGRLAHQLVLIALLELLDGNHLARLTVAAFEHQAVCALSYRADLLIILHTQGDFQASAWEDTLAENYRETVTRSLVSVARREFVRRGDTSCLFMLFSFLFS